MALTLDIRIKKDLDDLVFSHEISEASALNKAGVLKEPLSTKGLPMYFTGDRQAKTVLVMLNPRTSAIEADWNYRNEVHRLFIDDQHGVNSFYNTYIDAMTNFGRIDRHRYDQFDLKLAFFLYEWKDSGISFPAGFPNDKSTYLEAKEAILLQKLQLELIPYASETFSLKNPDKLIPVYVESLFDEIFSTEEGQSRYIIFCSNVFERLFKKYNSYSKNNSNVYDVKITSKEAVPSSTAKIGYCTKVIITRKADQKTIKVMIANTFANRLWVRSPQRMKAYGSACYQKYQTY